MKRSIKSLVEFTMGAIDGEIGKVKEFYFDDNAWTIRYLIIETGSWLFGRKVLISPEALLTPNWKKESFPVNLTQEQIKNSPDIDTEKPVSRQEEIKLTNHYAWANYWGGGFYGGGMSIPLYQAVRKEEDYTPVEHPEDNPHLRSTEQIKGYAIHATDDEIGEVEDFIVDDSSWKLAFLVVDTGHWFPGKKVLISPAWIKAIKWENSKVIVNVSVNRIKRSPEYDPTQAVNEVYEVNLRDYYGRLTNE